MTERSELSVVKILEKLVNEQCLADSGEWPDDISTVYTIEQAAETINQLIISEGQKMAKYAISLDENSGKENGGIEYIRNQLKAEQRTRLQEYIKELQK